MINQHHVGGNILEHQNLDLFFHMTHLENGVPSSIPYFTRQGCLKKWGEDRVFPGNGPQRGRGSGPSSGCEAPKTKLQAPEKNQAPSAELVGSISQQGGEDRVFPGNGPQRGRGSGPS